MLLTDNQREVLEATNLPLLLLLEAEEINSDDELDASKEQAEQAPEEEVPEEVPEEEMPPPPPTEEEQFMYELEGTEDKFVQFVLYDKLTDLASKIIILQDNIKNDNSAENINLIQKLDHYKQYLEVLNELIFSISTSVTYKVLGQVELELIDLLQVYNASLEEQVAKDKIK